MAKKTKKGQYAKVVVTVGGTAVDVAELREWSISAETEKIDDSAAGQDWTTHLRGMKSWEGEATFVDADVYWLGQLDEDVTIEFYDAGDDLEPIYSGVCSLDFERSVPYDDVIESSVTFTGNGELYEGAIPA